MEQSVQAHPAATRVQGSQMEAGAATVPRLDDNVVYVGQKNVMSYVLAVVTQFNNGAKEVRVKARGKLISRAVDVAEIVRNRFMLDVRAKDVKIGTEDVRSSDGGMDKVSSIEITLVRG